MSEGIYYAIRHKATGELMPQLARDRGYSWWNPSRPPQLDPKKFLGVPRIITTRRKAVRCIAMWNCNPNAKYKWSSSFEGEPDYDIDIEPDGRTKEDLEVVEIALSIIEKEN